MQTSLRRFWGLSSILIGLLMLLVAAAGFLDWYGVIEVPWLNKDRKTTSDDTPPPTPGD